MGDSQLIAPENDLDGSPKMPTETSFKAPQKTLNPKASEFVLRPCAAEWKPPASLNTAAKSFVPPSRSSSQSSPSAGSCDGHPDVPALSLFDGGASYTTSSQGGDTRTADSANVTDDDGEGAFPPQVPAPALEQHQYEDDYGYGDEDYYDDGYVEGYANGYIPPRLYRGRLEDMTEGDIVDWNQYSSNENWIDEYGNWIMEDHNGCQHEARLDVFNHWVYAGYSIPATALPGADRLVTNSNDGVIRYEADHLLSLRPAASDAEGPPKEIASLAEVASFVLRPISSRPPAATPTKPLAPAKQLAIRPRSMSGSRDSSKSGSRRSSTAEDDTVWKHVKIPTPKSSGKKGGARRGDRRRAGKGSMAGPPLLVSPADAKPLEVNEATRWKPAYARKSAEDETGDQLIVRKAQSILNKLSVEKFEKLSTQLLTVGLKTQSIVESVILMVVKKAQSEPTFSSMYAQLCLKMSRSTLPALETEGEEGKSGKKFRKLLLACCQREFEVDQAKALLQLKEMELPADVLAERELVQRQAYLGHVKFVGELYKVGLVREQIVHICIQALFGQKGEADEEKLASMVKLITTVGKQLETTATNDNYRLAVRSYIKLAKKLSQDKNLSSRIRFMLQDLVELRECNWVPRRAEVTAKTKAQVHKEAFLEAQGKSPLLQRSLSTPTRPQHQRSVSTSMVSPDGWEVVGSSGKKRRHQRFASQVPLSRAVSDGSGKQPLAKGKDSTKGGMFDALRDTARSRRKETQPLNPRKQLSFSSADVDIPSPPQSPPAANRPTLSEEEVKRKGKLAIEEYFVCEDLGEALLCMKELHAPEHIWQVIVEGINIVLEKKDKECCLFKKFIISLHKEDLSTSEDVTKAVHEFLEFLVDIEIDVPQAGRILATLVAEWLHHKVLPEDVLENAPALFFAGGGAPEFTFAVIEALGKLAPCDGDSAFTKKFAESLDYVKLVQNVEDQSAADLQQRCLAVATA